MLSLAKLPSQMQYNPLLHKPITQHLHFPSSKTQFSFSTRLDFHALLGRNRNGLCCRASKTKKQGGFSVAEIDGPDEIEDGFDFDDEFVDLEDDDDDDEFEGGEDDDDDDEVIVPLKNMKRWVQNKPPGFGEGKEYDTSVEDKLMEEIEQSRKAQLANLNKLKNSPVNTSPKKETSKQGSTHIQDGFRVRLVNLPKKKNIHKDLKLAFKGVPGLLNIVPVVSGNEKTRDPVCKGLAFVDFKYQDEAQRFIQNFSGKSISFGKVEKQVTCEMMISKLPNSASAQSVDESNRAPQQAALGLSKDMNALLETNVQPLASQKETAPSELDDEDQRHVESDDDEETHGASASSDNSMGEESTDNSSSSKKTSKLKTNEKKVASKRRKDRAQKSNIPGSANRLKIREKEMLTGVFSKYGPNATSTVKEKTR